MAGENGDGGASKGVAATILALLPAAGAAGGGAGLLARGSVGAGAALLGAGLVLAAVHHLVVQPRLDRAQASSSGDLVTAALTFAQKALKLRRVEEVGGLLGSTIHATLGLARTLLLVPEAGGEGVRVLGDPHASASAADDAYPYLAAHPYPVRRDDPAPEAEAVRQMCQRLGAELAFGLRHRGTLLGVLLVGDGTHPLDDRELEFLHRLGLQATVAIANTHLFDEASGRAGLSREVDLATAVQEDLLPTDAVHRAGAVSVSGVCRPAAECGGDFWFWRRLGDDRALVVIGDVTGHGLPAAIVAATAKGCCEACVADRGSGGLPRPAAILETLNRAVFTAGQGRFHMSCFALVLDGKTREVRFANAGHNFPYVVTPRTGEAPQLSPLIARGNTLGQVARAAFTETTRPLAPGERLVLYTDGVVEALSEAGEPYGDKRFRRTLVELGPQAVDALAGQLYRAVADHAGARPPDDDVTVVVAAFEGPGEATA